MDKLEKIKTEYALFEEEGCICSQCVFTLLEQCHFKMMRSANEINKSIKQNNLDCKLQKAKSIVGQIFGFDISYDCILKDTECLDKQLSLAKGFDNYFVMLFGQLNDENYLEVSKLTQFTLDKYLNNYSNLESLRNVVKSSSSGTTYYDTDDSDVSEFDTFFEEEFSNILKKGKKGGKVIIKND